MTVQRFFVATIAGGVSMLILGFVSNWLFAGVFSGYAVISTEIIYRDSPAVPSLLLGALAMGALLTVLLGCWTDHTGAVKALGTSAVFGLLLHLFLGMSLFGMTSMLNLTGTLIKVVIDTAQVAVSGMTIGAVLGRGGQTQAHRFPS